MSNSMNSQFEHVIETAIKTIPQDDMSEVYALSFFIYNEDDDPRLPTLTIGYNTTLQWRNSIPQASSSDEAKWNYAFWLQNDLLTLGQAGSQSAGEIARWISSLGLSYTDEEEEIDFERCLDLGEEITYSFANIACEVATALHHHGTVGSIFSRAVPIIVHELEYYNEIADLTERSNPSGLAEEFILWVRNLEDNA